MSIWELSEYAAWIVSAAIAIFLVGDAIRVSRQYDEEFLTHSLDELASEFEVDETGHPAGKDARPPESKAAAPEADHD